MSRVSLKRLQVSRDMPADEQIKIIVAHINDLETHLEILLDDVNRRLDGGGA